MTGEARSTLQGLAKRWGKSNLDVYQAAKVVGVRARKMGAQVSAAEVQRLLNHFFPPPMDPPRKAAGVVKGRQDNTAYLAAQTRKESKKTVPITATAPTDTHAELCACCGIPVPSMERTLCVQCLTHPEIHGEDRELVLARKHAERFRTDFLWERDRAADAEADRQSDNARANRWAAALVRTVVEHNRDKEGQGGRCSVCGVSAPCPVWRRLERANKGIATRILNQYYSLPPATLDERLADGIFTPDDEEDGV